ncbi:hypothetical protein C8J55DRAFT_565617 [Lentinula edodes]|uniref:BTB domain-containing protein n=1 Tax=Lentinula lateritia TaxID=40482 RepID=A0A9W9DFG0_9AGAR|nr:hypothetical protein C8J55DRAFT_565617 [Lentinula edodes]
MLTPIRPLKRNLVLVFPALNPATNPAPQAQGLLSFHRPRHATPSKYLEINIGAFPPAETPTNGEPVCLSESSETLEILFQLVYPRRYPLLETLDFDALMLLADAAEKYEVFPAIYACRSEFRNFLQTNSKSVLAFAAMHDYRELVIRLAPTMLDLSIPELVNILPNNLFKPVFIMNPTSTQLNKPRKMFPNTIVETIPNGTDLYYGHYLKSWTNRVS